MCNDLCHLGLANFCVPYNLCHVCVIDMTGNSTSVLLPTMPTGTIETKCTQQNFHKMALAYGVTLRLLPSWNNFAM